MYYVCMQAGWTPPDLMLGVLASDVRIAVRAYRDWCTELGVPYLAPESRVTGVEQVR